MFPFVNCFSEIYASSRILGAARRENGSKLVSLDLSAYGLGKLGSEFYYTGVLVRRCVRLDVVLYLLLELFGALGALRRERCLP